MMQYENFTFQEAMQSLADRAGIELPKQEMSAAQREAADRRSKLLEINKVAAKYFYMLLRSHREYMRCDILRSVSSAKRQCSISDWVIRINSVTTSISI